MSTGVTNYQCPNCTGPLHFSGKTGKLECEYCGSSFEVAQIEALYAAKDQANVEAKERIDAKREQDAAAAAAMGMEWSAEEAAGMRTYSCPSCRAELICDETTAATSCPYCGNPSIVPGQFSGGLKPDLIIPFKLDKDAAVKALKNYYKGKKFLPNAFSSQNHIEEIKGVYVPFWLYNCQVDGQAQFEASNSRTWKEGDYEITETDIYYVTRGGNLGYEKIPVDASTKMPDTHMDAVEPFDYSELKPFSTAYLPGYLADKYDVSQEDSRPRIETRAKNTMEDELAKTVIGYEKAFPTSSNINITQSNCQYALMPVWMLSTKWNGKNYLFAMNGQTGKLIGDLPIDKGKYFKWFAGIALPLMAILLGFWLL